MSQPIQTTQTAAPSIHMRMLAIIFDALDTMEKNGDLPIGLNRQRITIDLPKDTAHGELATNAAMILAKPAGVSPLVLGEKIAAILTKNSNIQSAICLAPGFVNMVLHASVWQEIVATILASGTTFGQSSIGQKIPVNVEYVSVNPTGPMHAGHARVAIVGDVLANLLAKAGYEVTREFYINDAGGQVDQLARSVYIRYQQALGLDVEEPGDGLYPGDYLIPVGQMMADRYAKKWLHVPEDQWLSIFRKDSVAAMMALIRNDLEHLGVHHDRFSSESEIAGDTEIRATVAQLDELGLIYTGVLEAPKGKTPDDWEPRPQLLFKSTAFGDDTDRPLQKSDGRWTYFAADVAYHAHKIGRGFKILCNIWGADHGGYIRRIQSAVSALTAQKVSLEILICQMVQLVAGGEALKMSKRAGTFVTLQDMLARVGKDVVRFIMMTRKNDAFMDFDFEKVQEQTKDNPVFYVQYAHARACSVRRQLRTLHPNFLEDKTTLNDVLNLLTAPSELALIRRLADWPRQIEAAARAREPHRIAFYLYEVAADFHMLWSKGKEDAALRFIFSEQPELTRARTALVEAARIVLASGMDVLGVTALEELRA